MTNKIVKDCYLLIKKHDRAGRMADTWEYSQVALPKARFSAELLAELRAEIPSLLEESQDHIVLKHVYIERRMLPLNIYLSNANDSELAQAAQHFGEAVRELV